MFYKFLSFGCKSKDCRSMSKNVKRDTKPFIELLVATHREYSGLLACSSANYKRY